MRHEERQPAGRGGECEAEGGRHVAGVEPGQRAGNGEAEALPGDGFGDGPEFRFHGLRRLPVLVMRCGSCRRFARLPEFCVFCAKTHEC